MTSKAAASELHESAPSPLPPRDRILASARELFYRHGLHGVGVDAIAEAAGTNKMTLYRHFASKDLLIAECMREIAADFVAGWTTVVQTLPDDPKDHLRAWLEYSFDPNRKDTDRGCALANAAIELPDKDHPAKRVIEENKRRFREKTVQLCREAGLKDPELLADELFLLCEGARVSIESVGLEGPAAGFPRIIEKLVENHS